MNRRSLQDLAKFAAGIVAADFLWLVWYSQQKHALPVSILGATVTPDIIFPSLMFDLAVFVLLVHYAWHIGKIPALRERSYLVVAGAVFTVVAVAHIWRIFTGSNLAIGSWDVPQWLSWIGVVVTAYLAYTSFHFAGRARGR